MDKLIYVVFLSMLPISELRGAIPLGIKLGYNPLLIFFLAVVFNSAIVFLLYFFLDFFHEKFMKFRFYNKIFSKYIKRSRRKLEKYVGTEKEAFGIYLLTAIPLPMTGAYTATVLSWFFGIKKRKAVRAIVLGVLTAGVIITFLSLGFIRY